MTWNAHIRTAFGASAPDDEIIEELAQHAAAMYHAARADGADDAAAGRTVDEQIAVWVREAPVMRRRPRRAPAIEPPPLSRSSASSFFLDVRYALRLLRHQPGYSAVVIATMALGIAATTVLASVTYGVLLKPLPWADAPRLVRLYETRQGSTRRFQPMMTNASYLAWRDPAPSTLDGLGAWSARHVTLTDAGEPRQIRVAGVTPGLFGLLGAVPAIGRSFANGEEQTGRPCLAILSDGFARELAGAPDGAIGRSIRLDGASCTVVGVMPASFAFPDRETRAWQPFVVRAVTEPSKPGRHVSLFQAIGRLRPGVTASQAAAEATARARALPSIGPVSMAVFGSNGPIEVSAVPMLQALTGDVKPAIVIMMAAVVLLLLTATANVASLQLARATVRRREYAIRAALGAGRGRLVRQSLTENVLLGVLGGLVALVLAWGCHRLLPVLLPADFPRLDDLSFDRRMQAFALLLSIGAGLAFGLLPALHAGRRNVVPALVEDSLAPVGGSLRSPVARARAGIMAGQVAIACVLLVSAVLLIRSFTRLTAAPLGYDASSLVIARLVLPDADYTPAKRLPVVEQIAARLRGTPGVAAVAYSTVLPFTSGTMLSSSPLKKRDGSTQQIQTGLRTVGAGYFAALGQRVVEGREFTAVDSASAQPAAVVNREFSRRYLDGKALGWELPGAENKPAWRIVGVVEDTVRQNVTDPPAPEVYTPAAQQPPYADVINFVIRTRSDPRGVVSIVRATVREAAPGAPIESIQAMEDLVSRSLARPRLYAVLLGTFAAFALAIAAAGLFGVLSYSVAQRSREIGVRTALGARPVDIIRLVVGQCLTMTGAGLAAGLLLAAWLAEGLSKFLYGVTPHDTPTFVGVALVLLAVSTLASYVPARRAASVDPVTVLKC